MKSALKAPTKAESHRIAWLKADGCIACRKHTGRQRYAEAHHILDGGRRVGHAHTIPLCPWHHRGEWLDFADAGLSDPHQVESLVGPSLARSKRDFVAVFGPELELLKETDDRYMESQIDV